MSLPPNITGRYVGTFTPDSPEWDDVRRHRVTASELGSVMGWNNFETRAELLARKRGTLPQRPATDATRRGHYLEAGIADWFRDETGLAIGWGGRSFVHPDHDWQLATPDRICGDGSLLEVKSASVKSTDYGWGRAGTSEIPLAYQAQTLWQMHVTGADVCHVAVLFGSPFAFAKYRVHRDEHVIGALVRAATRFHTELTEEIAA